MRRGGQAVMWRCGLLYPLKRCLRLRCVVGAHEFPETARGSSERLSLPNPSTMSAWTCCSRFEAEETERVERKYSGVKPRRRRMARIAIAATADLDYGGSTIFPVCVVISTCGFSTNGPRQSSMNLTHGHTPIVVPSLVWSHSEPCSFATLSS